MKRLISFFFFTLIFQWSIAQVPNQNSISPFKEVKAFNWRTPNGLPYVNDFSGSYSVEVFKQLDKNRYAFLSKSEQAILIFNMATGQKEKTIRLPFHPVDFTFSKSRFFVTGTQYLYVLNNEGKIIDEWFFGDKIKFVNSIQVAGNRIYMITPSQKSWTFDKTHTHLIPHDGVILRKDFYGKVMKQGKHQFVITLAGKGKESFNKTVTEKGTLGTVRITGMSGSLLFIEVQTVLNPVPLKVKREIHVYQISETRIQQRFSISLPDIYYTYIKHDVVVSDSNMEILVSTPEKARLYQLKNFEKVKVRKQIFLPDQLYKKSYLYNNHLLPAGEENAKRTVNMENKPISRQKILSNAEPYTTHKWFCNPVNIKDYDCGGVHVRTPDWVIVGNNVSIPYMWGGFSSLQEFDQGLKNGVSAGDCDTHGSGAGSSCAVGVDCSGFVSRAWGLTSKYSTRSIPNISTEYSSYDDLLPGDVVNRAGHHVRLIHTVNGNGSFLTIESSASGTGWRVGYSSYTTADLQGGYIPRYYNNIIEGPMDTIAPTTTISVNKWETADFQAHFTDTDNTGLKNRFYHVSYYDGSRWFANNNSGFFNDNFTNSISSQWKKKEGTWTILNDALNQSDETGTNTNIYAPVSQTAGNIYLYQWRMKIGGEGTNRRAGLYIMADVPTMTQRNNAYMIYFRVDQNTCQIYQSKNNSIDLETSDACTVDANVWFDAKVIYNTKTGEIDVFKDNVLVSKWVDSAPLTKGNYISLRTGNANVSYDDMKVYRSRTDSATITVGPDKDASFQNLTPAQPACLILSVAGDSMNNLSAVDSVFINIDWTRPSSFSVFDGTGADIDTIRDATKLSANWTAATDVNSGILAYRSCIGSAAGKEDVVPWFNNDSATRFTKAGLSLNVGNTYYVSVSAMNAAGLMSDTIVSDGVLLLNPLGINANEGTKKTFTIYPVPANGMLWLAFSNREITGQPEVFDLSGKEVPVTMTKISAGLWKINLRTVASGLYIIRIKTKTSYLIQKFSVVK